VAQEVGVDWTQIRGTGSSGRIRERDVRAHFERRRKSEAPSPVAEQRAVTPPEGRIIALSPLRKTIAARVRAGVERAAPVTLTTQCDVTNLVRLRRQFQQANEATDLDRDPSSGQPSIAPELARHSSVPSYTDFIIKLTATALEQHPMLMAQWTDQGIRLPDGIHINVAIHTEVGLVAPVIRDVPRLTLPQIAAATRTLVELAHARRLSAEQLASGTFTITNLGMVGIDAFTPILNVPQSAVLGIGRIRRVPAVVQDQIVPRDQITFSLTFDHRVLDGVPAAKFLDTLGSLLENPASCLTAQG
jgi:pyruvate dehydrogenase E2 component (dihydrolipoamide acetyltransferase)